MDNCDRAINGRRDAQTKRFHKEDVYFPREEMRILLLTKQIFQKRIKRKKNDSLMGAHSLKHRFIGCMT